MPEILADYEQHPAVVVNWALFGSSGHKTPPEGLVIENYRWRVRDHSGAQPLREVHRRPAPHLALASIRTASSTPTASQSTEQGRPLDRRPFGKTDDVSFARLRVNHYRIKSEEQWEAKRLAPMAHTGGRRALPAERDDIFTVRDETITAYAPAVRDAIGAEASCA